MPRTTAFFLLILKGKPVSITRLQMILSGLTFSKNPVATRVLASPSYVGFDMQEILT